MVREKDAFIILNRLCVHFLNGGPTLWNFVSGGMGGEKRAALIKEAALWIIAVIKGTLRPRLSTWPSLVTAFIINENRSYSNREISRIFTPNRLHDLCS